MYAKNLAILGITDDLYETFVLADDAGARVCREGELAHLYVVTGLFGFGLAQANAANFRMTIRRIGNAIHVDRLHRLACNVRDRNDTFHRARMRQLRITRGDVTDGVDARLVSAHELVDLYETALDLNLRLLKADAFSERGATNRNQDLFSLQLLLFAIDGERHRDATFRLIELLDLGIYEAVYSALAIDAHQLLGDFFIFYRHVARQHLQDGDVGAKGLVDAGEFNANRART